MENLESEKRANDRKVHVVRLKRPAKSVRRPTMWGEHVDVQKFDHHAGGVDWYCEQRGHGQPIVLVPSGEGDCASFDQVATQLADDFTVLTFDTPGFSRSRVRTADDISVLKLAEQIASLVESLVTCPATFYGCSSAGSQSWTTLSGALTL
jgi:pimeloyl-ACP methyl ester carboxylesterase